MSLRHHLLGLDSSIVNEGPARHLKLPLRRAVKSHKRCRQNISAVSEIGRQITVPILVIEKQVGKQERAVPPEHASYVPPGDRQSAAYKKQRRPAHQCGFFFPSIFYCRHLCFVSTFILVKQRSFTETMNPASFARRHLLWEAPVPTTSFTGKTVIVTGGNTGLGFESSRHLIRLGASRVILACRNVEKGQAAVKDLQRITSCAADVLDVWKLDMSSYDSVTKFSDKVKIELPRLDAVLACAGVMVTKFRQTEGNEESITTNVISFSLLACLLFPKLRETAAQFKVQTHITVPGSELFELAKLKERHNDKLFAALSDESKANMGDRYNVTKLLVVFVVRQMASMAPLESNNVIVNTISPG